MGKQNKDKKVKRYRLALIVDSTHQQIWQTVFTKTGLISIITAGTVIFIAVIFSIIAFTPVRTVIPGYPDALTKRTAIRNAIKIDSLEREIAIWDIYTENLQNILTGGEPANIDSIVSAARAENTEIPDYKDYSKEDSLLRAEISREERFEVGAGKEIKGIEGKSFYPPLKGIITEKYNPGIGHPFIDIAATQGATVYAVLDGTVIGSGWSDETGYTLQIQHSDNMVSVYKHNEKLLKQTGDKVKAGTPVAIAGNTGSLSTAPHLHFELWYEGEAVNPEKYINF